VQACLLVLVTGVGLVGSGFITGQIGLGGLFAVAAVVGVAAPFGAARRFPEERRA
jgi:hypothetical protein